MANGLQEINMEKLSNVIKNKNILSMIKNSCNCNFINEDKTILGGILIWYPI